MSALRSLSLTEQACSEISPKAKSSRRLLRVSTAITLACNADYSDDRSAPAIAGGVVSSGPPTSKGMAQPPLAPVRNSAPHQTMQGGHDDSSASASAPPQLAGLFSGGMPTLRKTPMHSNVNDVSQESSRSVSMPTTKVPIKPESPSRVM